MTTCFLLSYLVQFAASITLTANTLIDAVGSSIRSVSTSSATVESYKRPPNGENYFLTYPGMTFFWLFLVFVGVIFYALHNVYYKVGDSTEDPQMSEQKDQQQQQQSTNIVSKRECSISLFLIVFNHPHCRTIGLFLLFFSLAGWRAVGQVL